MVLNKELSALWFKYKNFLKINAKIETEIFWIMKKRYTKFFKKLISKRIQVTKNSSLDLVITNEFLLSENEIAKGIREKYLEYEK